MNQKVNSLTSLKRLRACMRCHLIKSEHQWHDEEICENCPFLKNSMQLSVMEFTTQHFEGFCAVTKPEESWLAKYLGVSGFYGGIYCLRVKMIFQQDIVESLERQGYKIVPNL